MKYRCIHCKKILKRDSTKACIKSYCDKYGTYTHLMRISPNDKNRQVDACPAGRRVLGYINKEKTNEEKILYAYN